MPNTKHTTEATPTYDPSFDDIPEEEKWRLIEQSGLLKQFSAKSSSSTTSSLSTVKNRSKSVPSTKPVLKAKDRQEKKADNKEDFEDFTLLDYVVQAFFFSFPFSILFGTFFMLVKLQYNQDFTWYEVANKSIYMFPVIFVIIYPTNAYKSYLYMKIIMTLSSIFCGAYMLYISNKASMYGTMLQAPGLATLWVYFVVQLDLIWALGGLGVVMVYYFLGLK